LTSIFQAQSAGDQNTKNLSRKIRAFVSLFASASLVFAPLNISAANAVEVELSLVKDINTGSDDGLEDELDGGEAGAFVGSTYFFPAYDETNGRELWKSDGTEAGTVLVKNIRAGSSGSSPSKLTAVGSTLYFSARDGTNGRELWKSDGTTAGTFLVKDIRPGLDDEDDPESGNPEELIAVGNTLYFSANDGTNGEELWKSDGTEAGTVMVKDIRAGSNEDGPYSSSPERLTAVGSTLYFAATKDGFGTELWKSDGTDSGTVLVADIIDGGSSGDPNNLRAVENTLYFSANDGTNGRELWKSDGTEAGTVMVKNISLLGDSGPAHLTAVGTTVYFSAYDDANGDELWKSDGTEAGTVMVKDIDTGVDCSGPCSSAPEYLTAVGNTLYFSAYDDANGEELWKSDGTSGGTVLVKDIWVGSDNGSSPSNLTALGSTLYFSADDGTNRRELWKSDGTGAGTSMVENINPNVGSGSAPMFFSASASTLFFRADNGTVGIELWALRPIASEGLLTATGTSATNFIGLSLGLVVAGSFLLLGGWGRRREFDQSRS
jgi:ELWxxDGT repeat protein